MEPKARRKEQLRTDNLLLFQPSKAPVTATTPATVINFPKKHISEHGDIGLFVLMNGAAVPFCDLPFAALNDLAAFVREAQRKYPVKGGGQNAR
jgi:hypothetical protein